MPVFSSFSSDTSARADITLMCKMEPLADETAPKQMMKTTNSQVVFWGARSKSLSVTAMDQKILRDKQVKTIVALLSNLLCNRAARMNPKT